jgi:hypothetical protein
MYFIPLHVNVIEKKKKSWTLLYYIILYYINIELPDFPKLAKQTWTVFFSFKSFILFSSKNIVKSKCHHKN